MDLTGPKHFGFDLAQLGFMLSVAAGCFFTILGFIFVVVFGTWAAFWWLSPLILRWRYVPFCIRAAGRLSCLLPRLVRFPASVWGRLPDYEQIRIPGWCDEQWGGEISPLNLYATLVLFGMFDLEWRSAYDGRNTARERIDEVTSWCRQPWQHRGQGGLGGTGERGGRSGRRVSAPLSCRRLSFSS